MYSFCIICIMPLVGWWWPAGEASLPDEHVLLFFTMFCYFLLYFLLSRTSMYTTVDKVSGTLPLASKRAWIWCDSTTRITLLYLLLFFFSWRRHATTSHAFFLWIKGWSVQLIRYHLWVWMLNDAASFFFFSFFPSRRVTRRQVSIFLWIKGMDLGFSRCG